LSFAAAGKRKECGNRQKRRIDAAHVWYLGT
jgi:hypothetical protein